MSASAKPTERAFKSLLAVVLAVSLCPLMPAGQAKAQEVGEGSSEMSVLSASVDDSDAQSGDADGAAAPQSDESGDPIVDWTTSGTARWMIDASGCLTIAPLEGEQGGELGEWSYRYTPWYDCRNSITSVKIEGAITASTAKGMFRDCSSLTSLDLSGLDTSSVESMSGMFSGCSSLKYLDVSGLDTSSATSMSFMFHGCSSLSFLDLSGLDTSSATGMFGMFSGCRSLESLDLSGFDTSKVTDMSHMFSGCTWLESLDLSGLDTSKVTDMSSMFECCSSLQSLDVSSFDTSKVTDMFRMFSSCSRLQSLDLTSFDTSKVANMNQMFSSCSSLGTVKLGEGFSFAGKMTSRQCDLPTPSGDGRTGLWLSSADGKAYAPEVVPNNVAATYTAQIKADISDVVISGIPAKMTATGSQLAPEPVVTFNGERLVEGRDYIVSYGENVEPGAGAGSVTVSATKGGNFTGFVTVYFDIEKKAEPADPEPQRFAVIYHLDGGANADANPASYVAGTAVALGSPTKEGYEFQGWFADPGFEKQVTEISADSTGDVELWAKWAQKAEPKPAPVFPDVDYGEWYAPGVTFVAGKGLITGYAANGHFGVGDPLTRGQLATILWRNACPEEAAAYDASTARNETGLSGVSDGEYYTAAANWAVREGIITGFERADGTYDFAASSPVSFEQLITILSRLCAAPGEVAAAGSDLSGFVDGDEASSWAAGAIAWAAKKGLVGGYDTPSGKVLAPGEEVARERVAVVLMRAFDLGIME